MKKDIPIPPKEFKALSQAHLTDEELAGESEDIFDDTQSGLLKQCEANIEEMTQQTRKALAISLVRTISDQAKINNEPIADFWASLYDA